MTPTPNPDRRPALADLLARWSAQLGWRVSFEHPSVSETARDLARIVLDDPVEVDAAVERFAHRMGSDGWTLADVADWVTRLAEAAGPAGDPLRRFDAGIAVGRGWSAGVLHEMRHDACTDALTGLATPPVLGLRLQQVHDQCRALDVDPRQVYGLVVVDVDTEGRSPLFRDAARVVVADRVSSAFHSGETVCETGGPIVVLASRTPALAGQMAELETALRSLAMLEATAVLVWLEDLPAHPALIESFLLDLAGR